MRNIHIKGMIFHTSVLKSILIIILPALFSICHYDLNLIISLIKNKFINQNTKAFFSSDFANCFANRFANCLATRFSNRFANRLPRASPSALNLSDSSSKTFPPIASPIPFWIFSSSWKI